MLSTSVVRFPTEPGYMGHMSVISVLKHEKGRRHAIAMAWRHITFLLLTCFWIGSLFTSRSACTTRIGLLRVYKEQLALCRKHATLIWSEAVLLAACLRRDMSKVSLVYQALPRDLNARIHPVPSTKKIVADRLPYVSFSGLFLRI